MFKSFQFVITESQPRRPPETVLLQPPWSPHGGRRGTTCGTSHCSVECGWAWPGNEELTPMKGVEQFGSRQVQGSWHLEKSADPGAAGWMSVGSLPYSPLMVQNGEGGGWVAPRQLLPELASCLQSTFNAGDLRPAGDPCKSPEESLGLGLFLLEVPPKTCADGF